MHFVSEVEAIEQRLGQLLDSPVVGCWIRGLRGEPGFWSQPVFELYGLEPCETVPPIEIILRQLDARTQTAMWQSVEGCAQGGKPFSLDYTVRAADGKTRILKSCGQLSRSATGEAVIIGTVQDLSGIQPLRTDLQRLAKMLRTSSLKAGQPEGFSTDQWDRLQQFIDRGGAANVSVSEMANQLALRPAEFSRRFRTTTGETPHQYLLRVRLERASQALLGLRERSIARVAVDFGFFDQSHFTRQFKRRYGLTPARFAEVMGTGV